MVTINEMCAISALEKECKSYRYTIHIQFPVFKAEDGPLNPNLDLHIMMY